MKWMQFLTPVAGMEAEEAGAYMKGEGVRSRSVLHDIAEEEKAIWPPRGVLWNQGAYNQLGGNRWTIK
jgi:hypothetical protein